MLQDVGDVLQDELNVVRARRSQADVMPATVALPKFPDNRNTEEKLKDYYWDAAALDAPLSALCLSGGGIRSAAFALGVLQGLAKRGLLDKFDYLSTVSGGGYAGSFLSAWVQRAGFDEVLAHLRGERSTDPDSPVRHLRRYSNYLNPHTGLLSADRLANIILYLRNLLLNWLVILPVIVCAIVLVKLVTIGAWSLSQDNSGFLAIIAASFMGLSFVDSIGQRPGPHGETANSNLLSFYRYEILPMLLGAVLATAAAMGFLPKVDKASALPVVLLLVAIGATTSLLACLFALYFSEFGRAKSADARLTFGKGCWIVFSMLVSWIIGASLVGLAIFGAVHLPTLFDTLRAEHLFVVLGPPIFIFALFLGEVLYVALTHKFHWADAEREWLARAAGHHMLAASTWLILFGLVLVGSAWFFSFSSASESTQKNAAVTLAGIGSLSGAITALLAQAKQTAATIKQKIASWKDVPRDILMAVATIVCIVALVVAISVAVDLTIFDGPLLPLAPAVLPVGPAAMPVDATVWTMIGALTGCVTRLLSEPMMLLVVLGGASFGVGWFTSYYVNINRFSMHGVYRNRLIRTFLGASHNDREPNELTDFDSSDNMNLAAIWPGLDVAPPKGSDGESPARTGKAPPLHVVNISLNVVGSSQLAWQERKAISFTATARWIGAGELDWSESDKKAHDRPVTITNPQTLERGPSRFTGFYRRADEYGDKLSLGSAMTISGAAVSPNMGYNSSPAYSILMTLFNVRLGAWYGNPGPSGEKIYQHSGPVISAVPLLAEALGVTTADRRYVYLSDGGHFENLGIYEMIRRRCRLIVVSDGGEDQKMAFADLGNAVRRAELDFGVRIRFESFGITGQAGEMTPCFAIGEVTYPEQPDQKGVLLYLKPCRNDKAPLSVRSYAATNQTFPHEPTTDQFFGETQFEAYRALGEYTLDSIATAGPHRSVEHFIDTVGSEAAAAKRRAARTQAPSGASSMQMGRVR
jgi:hypothetical protein